MRCQRDSHIISCLLLLFAIPAFFVGNQACEPCHAAIVKAYRGTPMAISSGRNRGPVTPGSFRHAASGVRYDISDSGLVKILEGRGARRTATRLLRRVGRGGPQFSLFARRISLRGSGNVVRAVGKVGVSPGYERDSVSRWNRAVEPSCLACHASQTNWREGSQNQYSDPPFAQDGVGCERCHGPGSLHIEGKGKMVNPAKLEPARRDSVCSQCHLSGEARVERAGRKFADYRPGDVLSEFVAYSSPRARATYR